ncbi:hypothetical protein KDX27_30375 [Burkholderia cenocepacia]|uniref:hypothetical protein n=1 Tax=Burkholderia cenocepacia TaxID=95486 RepID=UPI001B9D579A|nr:hypothetical protein [Burkholderia cenocepacia]MBR7905962.1 hypothetical protein [Burkholderia cenocepacia]MBR8028912.1 hypothetical protein [Burkholderia cenocepacia]MBR8172040.1 hypothetical protein [Burkholderia cenocepacia]MBR8426954.1 hypothetical protein [Burkholderia cenocepacia]
MVDLSTSAVDLPIASDDHDAAAAPASDTGESSGDAPAAAGGRASDISSSAAPASLSGDTAAADEQRGDGPAILTAPAMTQDEIAAATAAFAAAPMTSVALEADPTPAVSIDVEDHAEARERFAGLFVRLHGIEEDFVHALRNELNAIGTLLHLHSVASGKADATGDYSSSDLS